MIFFDCQVLQTIALHRGMGKYVIEVLRSFGGNLDVHLIFNSKLGFDKEVEEMAKDLKFSMHFINFRPSYIKSYENYEYNKKILNNFMEKQGAGKGDVYIIASIFLDHLMPVYPDKLIKMCIFYDLIPFQMSRVYLTSLDKKKVYYHQMRTLLESDSFLCISETVAEDLRKTLNIPSNRTVVINGGPIHADKGEGSTFAELSIKGNYLLMPTGEDPRKNNALAVSGFDKFINDTGSDMTLVLTSFFNKKEREKLYKLSEKILFTGNVNESTIADLYANATAIVFPSKYEGLGLPILDAVRYNKPVICSDIGAFMEISKDAFHVFSVNDENDFIKKLYNLKASKYFYDKKLYKSIEKQYSWNITNEIILENMSKLVSEKNKKIAKKVAVFIEPPKKDADIMKMIKYQLRNKEYITVTFFIDTYNMTSSSYNPLMDVLKWRPASSFFSNQAKEYSDLLFAVSKDAINITIKALSNSGVIIMNTYNLVHVYSMMLELGVINRKRYDLEKDLSSDMTISVLDMCRAVYNTKDVDVLYKDKALKDPEIIEIAEMLSER